MTAVTFQRLAAGLGYVSGGQIFSRNVHQHVKLIFFFFFFDKWFLVPLSVFLHRALASVALGELPVFHLGLKTAPGGQAATGEHRILLMTKLYQQGPNT